MKKEALLRDHGPWERFCLHAVSHLGDVADAEYDVVQGTCSSLDRSRVGTFSECRGHERRTAAVQLAVKRAAERAGEERTRARHDRDKARRARGRERSFRGMLHHVEGVVQHAAHHRTLRAAFRFQDSPDTYFVYNFVHHDNFARLTFAQALRNDETFVQASLPVVLF